MGEVTSHSVAGLPPGQENAANLAGAKTRSAARLLLTGLVGLLVSLSGACSRGALAPTASGNTTTLAPNAQLIAAGDIASCLATGDTATAKLVADNPGTVAVLGDNTYET